MPSRREMSHTLVYSNIVEDTDVMVTWERLSASKLIHAFVTSRLDNLNSLLVELPDYVLNKLQLVQNNAARLVAREKKSNHVTPLLKQLHWLPIEYRIKYKIVLIVYKCLQEMGPVYLTSLLTGYHPGTSMCLRSDKEELLDNKRTAKGYGDRAFTKSGPELWNALPLNIRNSSSMTAFKSSIKTHYYKICYVWKLYERTLKLYYEHC